MNARRSVGIVIAVLSLLVASCGGDDETGASADGAGLKIGFAALTGLTSPGYVMVGDPSLGEAHGLSFTWQQFGGSSPNCVNAALRGEIAFCSGASSAPLLAQSEGSKLRMLTNFSTAQAELYVTPATKTKLNVPDTATEKEKIGSLRGLRVGTSAAGIGNYALLQYVLQRNGLTTKDVNLVAINDGPSLAEALKGGRIDAAWWNVGPFDADVSTGKVVRYLGLTSIDSLKEVPWLGLFASEEWADSHRSEVEALYKTVVDTDTLMVDDPARAKQIIDGSEFFESLSSQALSNAYNAAIPSFKKAPCVTKDGWASLVELMKIAYPDSNFDGLEYESFIDPVAQC